jgi:hypothetical protein
MSEFDKYQRTDSIDENKPGDRVVARRVELMVKLIKGRVNYLAMLVLTALNAILYLAGTGFELPFYLALPYYLLILGRGAVGDPSKTAVLILCFAGAVLLFGLSVALFFLLKKGGAWYGVAKGYIIADSIFVVLLGVFIYVTQKNFNAIFVLLLNLAYHIFVFCYLVSASRADYALTVLPESEDAVEEDISILTENADPDTENEDDPEN